MTSNVAAIYAKALFKLASASSQLQEYLTQLEKAQELLSKPAVAAFFSAPQVSLKQKKTLLQKVLKEYFPEQLLAFLTLLLTKRRLNSLSTIVQAYRQLLNEHLGRLPTRLITAIPIEPESKEKLRQKLSESYQKNAELEAAVDQKLIGGGMLFIGNKMIDFSLKRKLNELKEHLLSIKV